MALVQAPMDEMEDAAVLDDSERIGKKEDAPVLDGSEKSEDGNAHGGPSPGHPAPCTPDSNKKTESGRDGVAMGSNQSRR